MATTTNYSWSTPDDTALVKDGAAAIRSLGTAIDTTVFTNAGAAIAKATVDAKGDLIAGTADNTVARLAVGTNGQQLVADSAEATGLKWAAPAGGGMTLLSTTTLSGTSTTISVTPTGYIDLAVYIQGVTLSAGESLSFQFNQVTSSNYQNLQTRIDDSTAGTATQYNEDRIKMFMIGVEGLDTTSDNQFVLNFYNCNSSQRKIIQGYGQYNHTRNYIFSNIATLYGNTAAITELKFLAGGGVTFTAGTVLVYGVK
jgi:hypothetical protein